MTTVNQETRHLSSDLSQQDLFRWLEDQDSPRTRAFLNRENTRLASYLSLDPELLERLRNRADELLQFEGMDLPMPDGHGGMFFLKRPNPKMRMCIYWTSSTISNGELLVDPATLSDSPYVTVSIVAVSPSGNLLAFGIREGGSDAITLRFFSRIGRRLLNGATVVGRFRGCVFSQDEQHVFHAQEAEGLESIRINAVRRYALDDGSEETIFHETTEISSRVLVRPCHGDTALVGIIRTELASVPCTSVFLYDSASCKPPVLLFRSTIQYRAFLFHGYWERCVLDGKDKGSIVRTYLGDGATHSETISPPSSPRVISYQPWGDTRVVAYQDGRKTYVDVLSQQGTVNLRVRFPEDSTIRLGRVDSALGRLFYLRATVDFPNALWAVDLRSGTHALLSEEATLVGPTSSPAVSEHRYPSTGGVDVALTIITSDTCPQPGPMVLTVYGAGGVITAPKYSPLFKCLLEMGISCAVAHVRGSGGRGSEWQALGEREAKQNSIDDVIHAGIWLVEQGIVNAHQLALAGQSHGAMLALCAMVQRPTLFRAVLALGPLADLLRFHLFGIGRSFVSELGDPNNPEQLEALRSISPYHAVRRNVSYPSVYIVSGDRDTRCDALHARKMVAALREAVCGQQTLLDYSKERGHKPGLPHANRVESIARRAFFFIRELQAHRGGLQ